MTPRLRKSLAAKSVAIGFIVSILCGNYWIILAIFKKTLPLWFLNLVSVTAIWIIISGVWLVATAVQHYIQGPEAYDDGDL